MRSANPTSGCSRPSHRAWASLSRTPGCSTRRSGCCPTPTERAAELAVINEIGAALAQQLEFQAIIDLVGERVGSIFKSRSIFIALHDPASDTLTFPYDMDEGKSVPTRVVPGRTRNHVDGAPVRALPPHRHHRGAGDRRSPAGRRIGHRSPGWALPIPAGNRVIGVIGLESLEANAFSEGDERLLNTLSASLGVALENARLFDETKRLLTETDARAAELAVVNEIGSALAEQLDSTRSSSSSATDRRDLRRRRAPDPAVRRGRRPHRAPLRDRGRRPERDRWRSRSARG